MALSEREQQVLRDLEADLNADDPALAQSLQFSQPRSTWPNPRYLGAGIALLLVGLAIVLAGVVVNQGIISIVLGVAGFAVAVWAVTLMLARKPAASAAKGGRTNKNKPRAKSARSSSFMDRQSERWERRRSNDR